MRRLLAAAAGLMVLLAGCSAAPGSEGADPTTGAGEALLAEHDLDGMSVDAIIDHLDRLGDADRPADLMASVRPDELLLSGAGQEVALDMPDDLFYLSVAPYVDETHECFNHSLTTCRGELSGQLVDLTVVDDTTGETLVAEHMTTFENGFVGLWLPRDITGTLTVSSDGRVGSVPISTGDDAPTCLTTLALA